MNAAKSFLKLNRDVCLGKFANELGFHSPKAQEYLKKGSDHHKTWYSFAILYVVLTLELLTPYVKESLNNGRPSSTDGYWEWCANITDSNYGHVQDMIFSSLHTFMMFRVGTRTCNSQLIFNGKTKINELFYAGKHPIYQNIMFQTYYDEINMPPR